VTITPTRQPGQVETPGPEELLIKEAHRRTRRRRTAYGLVALAVVVAVLATFVSGTFDRPGTRTSNGTPVSEVAGGLPRCNATQLRVSGIDANGAAVTGGWIVRLRNVSGHACSLTGYPSVQGVNQWNGAVLTAAHTRDSYIGGWQSNKPLPIVDLRAKGGVASFLVDFVGGNNYLACPYLNTLHVRIPHSVTVFTLLSTRLQVCKYFEAHPFVSGLTGSNLA